MNLRPLDDYLQIACANIKYCTKCGMRVGCPIRYLFYNVPKEVMFSKTFYGAENLDERKKNLIEKIRIEKTMNPEFSYK